MSLISLLSKPPPLTSQTIVKVENVNSESTSAPAEGVKSQTDTHSTAIATSSASAALTNSAVLSNTSAEMKKSSSFAVLASILSKPPPLIGSGKQEKTLQQEDFSAVTVKREPVDWTSQVTSGTSQSQASIINEVTSVRIKQEPVTVVESILPAEPSKPCVTNKSDTVKSTSDLPNAQIEMEKPETTPVTQGSTFSVPVVQDQSKIKAKVVIPSTTTLSTSAALASLLLKPPSLIGATSSSQKNSDTSLNSSSTKQTSEADQKLLEERKRKILEEIDSSALCSSTVAKRVCHATSSDVSVGSVGSVGETSSDSGISDVVLPQSDCKKNSSLSAGPAAAKNGGVTKKVKSHPAVNGQKKKKFWKNRRTRRMEYVDYDKAAADASHSCFPTSSSLVTHGENCFRSVLSYEELYLSNGFLRTKIKQKPSAAMGNAPTSMGKTPTATGNTLTAMVNTPTAVDNKSQNNDNTTKPGVAKKRKASTQEAVAMKKKNHVAPSNGAMGVHQQLSKQNVAQKCNVNGTALPQGKQTNLVTQQLNQTQQRNDSNEPTRKHVHPIRQVNTVKPHSAGSVVQTSVSSSLSKPAPQPAVSHFIASIGCGFVDPTVMMAEKKAKVSDNAGTESAEPKPKRPKRRSAGQLEKRRLKRLLYEEKTKKKEAEAALRATLKPEPIRCKIFSLGRCNNDNCGFSHDFVPERIAELCKFYLTDSCMRGQNCVYYHSDWPCKFYHKFNKCTNGDNCKFSHAELTEEMRVVFEKSMAAESENIMVNSAKMEPQGVSLDQKSSNKLSSGASQAQSTSSIHPMIKQEPQTVPFYKNNHASNSNGHLNCLNHPVQPNHNETNNAALSNCHVNSNVKFCPVSVDLGSEHKPNIPAGITADNSSSAKDPRFTHYGRLLPASVLGLESGLVSSGYVYVHPASSSRPATRRLLELSEPPITIPYDYPNVINFYGSFGM